MFAGKVQDSGLWSRALASCSSEHCIREGELVIRTFGSC